MVKLNFKEKRVLKNNIHNIPYIRKLYKLHCIYNSFGEVIPVTFAELKESCNLPDVPTDYLNYPFLSSNRFDKICLTKASQLKNQLISFMKFFTDDLDFNFETKKYLVSIPFYNVYNEKSKPTLKYFIDFRKLLFGNKNIFKINVPVNFKNYQVCIATLSLMKIQFDFEYNSFGTSREKLKMRYVLQDEYQYLEYLKYLHEAINCFIKSYTYFSDGGLCYETR